MKKLFLSMMLFWLIHFHNGSPLQVDRLVLPRDDDNKPFFYAVKNGKTILVSWATVLYIEEK